MRSDDDPQRRNAIVERHLRSLARELVESGFNVVGIAGGVVVDYGLKEGSTVHTMSVLAGNATCADAPASPQQFIREVGHQMVVVAAMEES